MCRECYFSSIILLPSSLERRQAGKGRQLKAPESLKGELSGAGFIGWVGFLLFFGHFLLVLGNELVLKVSRHEFVAGELHDEAGAATRE